MTRSVETYRRGRGRPRSLMLLAPAVLVIFAAAMSVAGVQPPESESTGSYQYLSENSQKLIDRFLSDVRGLPPGAASYNSLEVAERSTYEAIMHALESLELHCLITDVNEVWGVTTGGGRGRDSYRISVNLASGAPEKLEKRGFGVALGHVKSPDGQVVGRLNHPFEIITALARTGSARQPRPATGEAASLQVSWLRDTPTTGEVDIDYSRVGVFGRNTAMNSDVRMRNGVVVSHYRVHVRTYGEGLVAWWRR